MKDLNKIYYAVLTKYTEIFEKYLILDILYNGWR